MPYIKAFKKIFMLCIGAFNAIQYYFNKASPPIHLFCWLSLFNFPGSYLLWNSVQPDKWKIASTWQIVAAILNVSLLINRQWPKGLKPMLPFLWYGTVLYTLPFLCTLMALQQHFSQLWQLYSLLTLILLSLILDWLAFTFILPLGILLGWLSFHYFYGEVVLYDNSLVGASAIYGLAILMMILFSRNRQRLQDASIQGMQIASASIAHELRTPLAAVNLVSYSLRQQLSQLKEDAIRPNDINIMSNIQPHTHKLLHMVSTIQVETQAANHVINMLLVNVKPIINQSKFEVYCMKNCILSAIERYPLTSEQSESIRIDTENDFNFFGEKTLMIHVFFNFLKNSLASIRSDKKNAITIRLARDDKTNNVYFKDTGKGIPKKALKHIFDPFFSRSKSGTGVGLAFCKRAIDSFNGTLSCQSKEGEYTLFTISLPRVVDD